MGWNRLIAPLGQRLWLQLNSSHASGITLA
jgi:hypothetical protein